MSMKSDAGFTLIEVVVAFVIAALVMVAALQLFGGAFDGSARAERLTRNLVAAESTLSEIGITLPLRVGEQRGTTAIGQSWVARIQPHNGLPADADDRIAVRVLDVTVTVSGSDGAEPVTLRTLKLAPRGNL
jgi:general secretion pathway protein I